MTTNKKKKGLNLIEEFKYCLCNIKAIKTNT